MYIVNLHVTPNVVYVHNASQIRSSIKCTWWNLGWISNTPPQAILCHQLGVRCSALISPEELRIRTFLFTLHFWAFLKFLIWSLLMLCFSVLLAPIGPFLAHTHLLDKQMEFRMGKCLCHSICNHPWRWNLLKVNPSRLDVNVLSAFMEDWIVS